MITLNKVLYKLAKHMNTNTIILQNKVDGTNVNIHKQSGWQANRTVNRNGTTLISQYGAHTLITMFSWCITLLLKIIKKNLKKKKN